MGSIRARLSWVGQVPTKCEVVRLSRRNARVARLLSGCGARVAQRASLSGVCAQLLVYSGPVQRSLVVGERGLRGLLEEAPWTLERGGSGNLSQTRWGQHPF
jgi:hypothetical protein